LAGSYSIAAMWSPLTPRCFPSSFDRPGRSFCERIRMGALPIAPVASTRALHSISCLAPEGWRVGWAPPLSIGETVTMKRYGRAEDWRTDSTWRFGLTRTPRRSALGR
jgi:hypothetical protein